MGSTHIGFPLETVAVFVLLSVGAILIDLFMHRDDKPIPLKSAVLWSLFWVAIAFAFAGFLYVHHGAEVASLFVTGYALEKVLSVDNLFVMMAIFSWFSVPDGYRHRVLYWGVIGAIVFRGIFVAIGTGLLALGPWVELVFAAIVGWTAVMMLRSGDDEDEIEDYSQHLAYRMVKRFFPIWPKLSGHAFLLKQSEVDAELAKPENAGIQVGRVGKAAFYATPLMLCLAVVELSDVMFAFDSVPAVIAVSREPDRLQRHDVRHPRPENPVLCAGSAQAILGAFGESGNRASVLHCHQTWPECDSTYLPPRLHDLCYGKLGCCSGSAFLWCVCEFHLPRKER